MRFISLLLLFLITLFFPSCDEALTKVDALSEKVVSLEEKLQLLGSRLDNCSNGHTVKASKCKKSKPVPIKTTNYSTASQKTKAFSSNSYNYDGRCNAITKKGTQCKRSSRSGGYCWLHGG